MKINVIKGNGLLVAEPLNAPSKYGLDIWGAIRLPRWVLLSVSVRMHSNLNLILRKGQSRGALFVL